MGMKFDLTFANWLACVADPSMSIAKLGQTDNEKAMLRCFLNKQTENVFSSSKESQHDLDNLKILLDRLVNLTDGQSLADLYIAVREYLQKKQWIAIIIPSGVEPDLDDILCDPELLGYLVRSTKNEHGLILQLEELSYAKTTLFDVHGVLGTALNDSINWPGILLWSPGGDSIFLPVSSVDFLEIDIEARVQWVFSRLFSELKIDLGQFKAGYKQAFPEVYENENKIVNILHLSDFYVGNKSSSYRMMRVQHFIRSLVDDLGEASKIIPVITGNLMDNPSETHIKQVRSFWEFLSGMGTENPLLVFGNNDVRKDGNINESYRKAIGFQDTKVNWYEDEKLAIISLNTVLHGNLQQGALGKEQLEVIENEIERRKDSEDYKFVMLLHHLPISYEEKDSAMQVFYKKIIGEPVVCVDAIEGASLLMDFVKKFSISVLLHGCQQAPLINQTEHNIPVVGCGSSTGIRSKTDGSVYFSINIISINPVTNKMSSRLLAIRKPENGLVESKRHEVLFRTMF